MKKKTPLETPRHLVEEIPDSGIEPLIGVNAIGKALWRDPLSVPALIKTYNLPVAFVEGQYATFRDLLDRWTTSRIRETVDLNTDWNPIIAERLNELRNRTPKD